MWRNFRACSSMAATTRGCECPVVTTAMPAVKSRKRLPSTSVTQQPLPWSMTNGYVRVKLGDIALASRAIHSAALGPGRGVWISGRRSAAMPADNISVVKLTQRQVRILNGLHYATVATVMPDCSPEATIVWIETDGRFIYFNTAFPRLKASNLKRDNRVAITVFDPQRPYHDAFAIRGRAELIIEGANEHIEKLARKYTGRKFRGFRPDQQRVIVKVTPERIHVQ